MAICALLMITCVLVEGGEQSEVPMINAQLLEEVRELPAGMNSQVFVPFG